MGITGLLPCLKEHMKTSTLSCLRGKTIGVDAYAWLHKAVYGCAVELCAEQEQACDTDCNGQRRTTNGSTMTTKWIKYILNLVDMFIYHNIKLVMVFDGADLLAKAQTESSRASSRSSKLLTAKRLSEEGKVKEAYAYFAGAVDVNPWMAAKLIRVLKSTRPEVQTMVAPHEADAQLSLLCNMGLLDAVVGEDSDMIPYGVPELILKLDAKSGSYTSLLLSDIYSKSTSNFDMRSFDASQTQVMCVTAGCDYLPSIKGIGIRKAHSLVQAQKLPARVLKCMRLDGLIPLQFCMSSEFVSGPLAEGMTAHGPEALEPGQHVHVVAECVAEVATEVCTSLPLSAENIELRHEVATAPLSREPYVEPVKPTPRRTAVLQYELAFYRACATFRHQIVFDPVARTARPLQPLVWSELAPCLQALIPLSHLTATTASDIELAAHLPFLGMIQPAHIAQGIADGLLHPSTLEPFALDEPMPVVSLPPTRPDSDFSSNRTGARTFGMQRQGHSKAFLSKNGCSHSNAQKTQMSLLHAFAANDSPKKASVAAIAHTAANRSVMHKDNPHTSAVISQESPPPQTDATSPSRPAVPPPLKFSAFFAPKRNSASLTAALRGLQEAHAERARESLSQQHESSEELPRENFARPAPDAMQASSVLIHSEDMEEGYSGFLTLSPPIRRLRDVAPMRDVRTLTTDPNKRQRTSSFDGKRRCETMQTAQTPADIQRTDASSLLDKFAYVSDANRPGNVSRGILPPSKFSVFREHSTALGLGYLPPPEHAPVAVIDTEDDFKYVIDEADERSPAKSPEQEYTGRSAGAYSFAEFGWKGQ